MGIASTKDLNMSTFLPGTRFPILAAAIWNPGCVETLIRYGADVNTLDHKGYPTLGNCLGALGGKNKAVEEALVRSCKILLAAGANPKVRYGFLGFTPLQEAAYVRNVEPVSLIISKLDTKDEIEERNFDGQTAIQSQVPSKPHYT
ncbi:hypothetical protein ABW20_dc0107435 [Dactylellina cionopaga]|nr:hypothetical protein ABW20_dc0107435 [Dactylellina cionopaga]